MNLCADVKLEDRKVEVQIEGESQISSIGGKILRVWLEPGSPAAFPPTVQAILGADLIIIGPGSLYTSLLANLLVPDLRDAIRASRATKFYVCNVATQPGETDHFTCNDHLKTIERHIGGRLIDVAICNTNFQGSLPQGVDWVKLDPEAEMEAPYTKLT